jgi:hypothetical protein
MLVGLSLKNNVRTSNLQSGTREKEVSIKENAICANWTQCPDRESRRICSLKVVRFDCSGELHYFLSHRSNYRKNPAFSPTRPEHHLSPFIKEKYYVRIPVTPITP